MRVMAGGAFDFIAIPGIVETNVAFIGLLLPLPSKKAGNLTGIGTKIDASAEARGVADAHGVIVAFMGA